MILVFYTIFLVTASIDVFLNEFMNTRRAFLVENASSVNSKNLVFTKSYWASIENQNEFMIDQKYYDVISHKTIGNKVMVKVVRDDFEIVLKKTVENLAKKNGKNKKQFRTVSFTQFITQSSNFHIFSPKEKSNIVSKPDSLFDDNFLSKIFQPPKV